MFQETLLSILNTVNKKVKSFLLSRGSRPTPTHVTDSQ